VEGKIDFNAATVSYSKSKTTDATKPQTTDKTKPQTSDKTKPQTSDNTESDNYFISHNITNRFGKQIFTCCSEIPKRLI
jgi:hypothetical protein